MDNGKQKASPRQIASYMKIKDLMDRAKEWEKNQAKQGKSI
jgi:hypothetical protein